MIYTIHVSEKIIVKKLYVYKADGDTLSQRLVFTIELKGGSTKDIPRGAEHQQTSHFSEIYLWKKIKTIQFLLLHNYVLHCVLALFFT